MNHLCITGRIHFEPIYEQIEGTKVIRLTIKHIDQHVQPKMAVMLKCEWYNPPPNYWKSPKMTPGTLVYLEGPIYQSLSKNEEAILNRTPFVKILHFDIRTTQEDFLEMQRRAAEKGRRK